jgi:hypothetical protein
MANNGITLMKAFARTEIADQIGVSTKTFGKMVAAGRFPMPDISYTRTQRWSADLLEQWLLSQRSGE